MRMFIIKIYTHILNILKSAYIRIKSFLGRYKFQTILSCLIIFAIFLIVSYEQKIGFDNLYNELFNINKPFYIVHIAFVLAAVATAIFTWWKNSLSHKQTEIQNEQLQYVNKQVAIQFDQIELQKNSRLDSLFAQGVEFLKSTNDLITRKSGVHILNDLAVTSPKHVQKCIDVLCSLNETWMPLFLKKYPDFFIINENFPNIGNIEEIRLYKTNDENDVNQLLCINIETRNYKDAVSLSQLVLLSLSYIIKFVSTNLECKGPYYFSYKYLCSIELEKVELNIKFKLNNINLQSANLKYSKLENTDLWSANLKSADLTCADLNSAILFEANLQSSRLIETCLSSAKLSNANLQSAHLDSAEFFNAYLNSANFQNAYIDSAWFNSAYLKSANFNSANLVKTSFDNADTSFANFQNANLYRTSFNKANLENADFSKSELQKTDFRYAKNIDKAIFSDNIKDAIFTDEDYKRLYPKR